MFIAAATAAPATTPPTTALAEREIIESSACL